MNSRGAATECSPGREPGVFFRHNLSPGGAKESSESFAPPGLRCKRQLPPGLRPGLHSVAAPRLNTDAGTSLTTLNASTRVSGDDGIPHRAGSPHSRLDIGGEHKPLAHQIARKPLHAIQVVPVAPVALGERETGIVRLPSLLRGSGA